MSFISEISTSLISYIKRPALYPELGRKIIKNIFYRNSATKGKDLATDWCIKNSITQEEAVKLFNNKDPKVDIFNSFKDETSYALEKEKNSPVKMGGAGALNLIYVITEHLNAKNVLETGVAYGWSSLAILLSLQNRNGVLYSSDMPYVTKNNDDFVGIVIPESLKKYWKLFRYADQESLPKIFKEQNTFDFIHYDSDKAYKGRMWAYNTIWPKVKAKGVFMSDDISDNSAFMDFCIKKNLKPIIVSFDDKFAGLIIKD
ncbi:class I SAM-dependent methyltransferase [Empedobacter falsenii]